MKKTYILTITFLLIASALHAQTRTGKINPEFNRPAKGTTTENQIQIQERSQMPVIKAPVKFPKDPPELIDTLNFPLQGEYSLYTFEGGYVSGNNSYDDKAKANVFTQAGQVLLKGVLIDFAVATSNNISIEIAAWDNTGTGNSPGNKITGTTISLDDIFLDVLNEQTTYIPFETPALMTSTFYVGVILPTGADTVAIFTNSDGDTNPATAWEQWSSNQWFRYDAEDSWGYNMAHAIFPIIDSDPGLTANFFANPASLQPGSVTSFFDSSIGGPDSWEWNFEGGTPASSAEQNPMVVYNQEGLFDVTLIVGMGDSSDTLVREDYILVSSEIPVQTDTLNYPLEGVKTLYEIVDNNGNGLGYICGNNVYNDLAKANYFNIQGDVKITGMLVDFVVATGGNPSIELAVWNNDGPQGRPGTKLTSQTVELNTIKSNIVNNVLTYVEIDPPVALNHPFYAGFILPTAAGDTLAAWSNEDGDTFPGIAWDRWEDNSWVALSDQMSWAMNIAMGIHPVVEYQTGIHFQREALPIRLSPNPTSGRILLDLSKFSSAGEVELMSLNGKALMNFPLKEGADSIEIDLSAFPPGLYLVRIGGANATGFQKIILH